ncbi:hypothetical protein CsSME_00032566 [Camellia sinensis var. sinensis]
MALKAVPIWVCVNHTRTQLGFTDLGSRRSGSDSNLRFGVDKSREWECCGMVLSQRAITPVEDEKPLAPRFDSPGGADQTQITESRGFHRDLNSLPSEFNQIS